MTAEDWEARCESDRGEKTKCAIAVIAHELVYCGSWKSMAKMGPIADNRQRATEKYETVVEVKKVAPAPVWTVSALWFAGWLICWSGERRKRVQPLTGLLSTGEEWCLCTTWYCCHRRKRKETDEELATRANWTVQRVFRLGKCSLRLLCLLLVVGKEKWKAVVAWSVDLVAWRRLSSSAYKCRLWSLMNGVITKHRQILLMNNSKEEAKRMSSFGTVHSGLGVIYCSLRFKQ